MFYSVPDLSLFCVVEPLHRANKIPGYAPDALEGDALADSNELFILIHYYTSLAKLNKCVRSFRSL